MACHACCSYEPLTNALCPVHSLCAFCDRTARRERAPPQCPVCTETWTVDQRPVIVDNRAAVVPGVRPAGHWTWYARGLIGYACAGDGNCFWRAAAVQIHGDQDRYVRVRRDVYTYVKTHPDVCIHGLPIALAIQAAGFADLDDWFEETMTDGTHGGFVEAVLLSQCFGYRVEVYLGVVPAEPTQIVNPDGVLCLRFHFYKTHYNALFVDTAGGVKTRAGRKAQASSHSTPSNDAPSYGAMYRDLVGLSDPWDD